MHVSLLIPMYQQRSALARLLPALDEAYADVSPRHTFEAVIVDDASTDRTFDAAWPWSERAAFPVKVVRLQPHEGLGGAIRQGFEFCLGAAVVTWDAEVSRPFADVAPMIGLIESGADVVTVPQPDTTRGERLVTGAVTGVSNIHRAYRRAILPRITHRRDGSLVHAELLANAAAAGLGVVEADVAPGAPDEDARPTWLAAVRLRRGRR